ncbi:nuclear transport factor 2 family protein [Rhodohalobacter sp.]|uniref:nuclear transport factor 2 family protein n=1 Tax=Rhodohalobacter sp. TaxID=1974210 RepID=UPI002ACE2A54|nr:nuclear transport factor 2 family protein [Rhodohalobacter sp.]MDZ7754982.1 nuclear transport factor 2 family protein [Rhodohalobacter sp.]
MKRYLLLFLIFITPLTLLGQTEQEERETLTELLNEFLEGASYNDAATHDRFWAEDLIYTGSNGNRIAKSDIMSGVNENPDRSEEPETLYSADEIQIMLFDDTAVVAFKLVAEFEDPNESTLYFYNTGTFVKRDGLWKVIAWQATSIPEE